MAFVVPMIASAAVSAAGGSTLMAATAAVAASAAMGGNTEENLTAGFSSYASGGGFGGGSSSGGNIDWMSAPDANGISWMPEGVPLPGGSSGGGGGWTDMLPSGETIGKIAGVAGDLTTAAGQVKQGQATSQAASYNANIADLNAEVARQNATWIGQVGQQQVKSAQMRTKEQVGGIKANQAASGINVDSESASDVRESARQVGQDEALNARVNASRLAYGQKIEAASKTSQGELLRSQAKQATTAGNLEAAGTLMTSLSNPNSNYLDFIKGKSLTGQ